MASTILFHNAVIHTVDETRPRASWLTVRGDRIQRVGDGPAPQVHAAVDLGGRAVVPGFVDAHAHFFQTGLDSLFVDLGGSKTVEDVMERLRAGARGPRSWIFAAGFEEDALTDATRLTRADLDAAFPERPVWVNRVDYHSAIVNGPALRRLDIPKGTAGLMLESGAPNGILRANAYFFAKVRVSRVVPVELRDRAVKAAANLFISRGITAVHALEGGQIFGEEGVHAIMKHADSLPLDLTLFLQEKNVYFTKRLGVEHLGGCILLDGSIGSYTAAVDFDYEGQPGERGILYEKSSNLQEFIDRAHRNGVQLAFHAIGPRAIDQLLRAYERTLNRTPRYDHRHRVEHFELATDDQIGRMRDLGLIASMQPAFEYLWGGPRGMYASRLGDAWKSTNRLRTILSRGVRIAGGSDANVTPPNPLLGIHAAVNHPNLDERIDVRAALRMMTLDAAHAAFNDVRHGSISPGKEASFVILGEDLTTVPSDSIEHVPVLETWCRGRRVYSARGAERMTAAVSSELP